MDNQQETYKAFYVAGLFDGEGSLTISRYKRAATDKTMYQAQILFTNTDDRIIKEYVDFLKHHAIAHHIRADDRTGKGRKICYNVQVAALDSQRRWLELMAPYLVGKKAKAQLLLEFVNRRIGLNKASRQKASETRLPNGTFSVGGRAPHVPEDVANYEQMHVLLWGSSETTRVPVVQ